MPTRHALSETEVVTRNEAVSEAPRRPDILSTRAWLQERINVWVAIGVGISWFVLTEIAAALEPATNRPEPLIGTLLIGAMDVVFVVLLVGLAMRRRWGLVASLAGAVLSTAMVVACPTSGHHQFGNWWYGEMACVLALVAISVAALRYTPAERSPREAPRSTR
jgi:hypothetical protein